MADYLRPDVYVEEVNEGEKPIKGASTSVGALIGITARGIANKPTLVTSWSDFIRKFALGLDSPFMRTSDLAHSVYGFFQNGGTECYVIRVGSETMAKATATLSTTVPASLPESEPKVTTQVTLSLVAIDEGEWANDKLVVDIVENKEVLGTFDVVVKYNNVIVENYTAISNDLENDNYYGYTINEESRYFHITNGVLSKGTLTFTGGSYDVSKIKDAQYTATLQYLDSSNVNMIAFPGKTSIEAINPLLDYCNKRDDCFAIIDLDKYNASKEDVITHVKKLKEGNGACYYPWGKIVDPLAKNNRILRDCPPSGHIMGVYARTDTTRGVHKAPAGEEAILRGFVSLTDTLTPDNIELLNPKSVNCILAKPNKNIVVWGARSLHKHPKKRYVSDVRYDMYIRKSLYLGLQWALFEPNGQLLWSKMEDAIKSFLDSEWRKGALLGETASEAYFVKCDDELNTSESMDKGFLISEAGYSKRKPAEFVVTRLTQKQSN